MPDKMPIMAPTGASAVLASQPDMPLDSERYRIYEANPAPWWVAALWLAFFAFAFTYLMNDLLQLG